MKAVLYPGSFDPITYGHMDVVEQSLKIFDKVIIAVLVNSKKSGGLFTIDEREALIKDIYKDNPNVEVVAVSKKQAAVNIALENGCTTIVKGLRNVTDYSYEVDQAKINLEVVSKGAVNTIAVFADPDKSMISSTMVKELFELGIGISEFVHPIVEESIKSKYKERKI